MKKASMLLMIVLAVFLFSSVASAASWWEGQITRFRIEGPTSQVYIEVYDAVKDNTKGGYLYDTDIDMYKSMLASILTVKANGTDIKMRNNSGIWDIVEIPN